MSLIITVGGQFGGEGKGLISSFIAQKDKISILVKTGGPNSGHTYGFNRKIYKVHMIPSGSNLGPSFIVFPPGCLIHPQTLFYELNQINFKGSILIDPNAGIIEQMHISEQKNDQFYEIAGSTKTGTGAAISMRAKRRLRLAKNETSLQPFLVDTVSELYKALQKNRTILVEGSQSFGLSNYHGDYPYVTSRDTTVGSFLAQIGLGPKFILKTILVLKCFPTRNRHGNAEMPNELKIEQDAVFKKNLTEFGGGDYTGGDTQRRVGLFDFDIVNRAVLANSPDLIALTGLDRLKAIENHSVIKKHYGSIKDFIFKIEKKYKIPVAIEGWGPFVENIIDKRTI